MLSREILDGIEDKAKHAPIREIIGLLVGILGKRMTVFLSGVRYEAVMDYWQMGLDKPSKIEELRLRYGYQAAAIICAEYDTETAKAIFMGMNPTLGDERRRLLGLRDHEKEEDLKYGKIRRIE